MAKHVNNHRFTQEVQRNSGSSLTYNDLAKLAIAQSDGALAAAREEISGIRKSLPDDKKTRIGTISWANQSPIGMAFDRIGKLGNSDPILRRAQREWALTQNPRVRYDPSDSTHDLLSRAYLADKIVAEIKTLRNDPTNQTNFKQLKDGLEQEIADARKKGLLIFNAAGNDGEKASIMGDATQGTIVFDSIKGMITVGATDLSSPRKMWDGSAAGTSIEIAAPGVDIPTGEQNNRSAKVTGTSFAAPYAASVAALMVAANPKLKPDDIEQILTSGNVTTDIPNTTTDGKGVLDPVKVVKEAKKFKPAAGTNTP